MGILSFLPSIKGFGENQDQIDGPLERSGSPNNEDIREYLDAVSLYLCY